jgi:hypothetical protein
LHKSWTFMMLDSGCSMLVKKKLHAALFHNLLR